MHSSRSRTSALLTAFAAVFLGVAVPAAARAEGAADAGGAGVGVARVSVIQGAVAIQRGDSATPVAAAINAPVLAADYVTTGDGARAEIQFDGSSSVRLGADVQMRFTHLDTGDRELQLAAGTIDVRLLRGTDGRSQIDTPSVSIRPRATGSYRISVDASGRTQVTVRAGTADVVTAQSTQVLTPGTTLVAQGTAASPSTQSTDALALDDFDRFNRERDDPEERALASLAYTAPGVAGLGDLDTYGRWVTDGGYGTVWVPTAVAPSWAPYRDGRWVWEEGYGWTWLGYEPWGWAPYHYGRWYHSAAYGWCWYPERSFITWRPAVVAFLGFGSGFGFGYIGWVPLAPFEPYYAWWGPRNASVTYVTNNYYYGNDGDHHGKRGFGNLRYHGGTFVAHERFLEGKFDRARPVDGAWLRAVKPVRGVVPAVPTAANLRFSDKLVAAHLAVAPALLGGTFAGNDIAVRRMPFAQQRDAMAVAAHPRVATVSRPAVLRTATVPQQPAAQRAVTVTNGTTTTTLPVNVTPRSANDPWTRFGASRGTPVTHPTANAVPATTSAAATTAVMPATPAHAGAADVSHGAPDSRAWRHFDATRPAADTPVRRATLPVQDTPRTSGAPRESRESGAPRQAQPQPAPAQVQQRSAPPPARTEHPPAAAKSTSPH